MNCKDQLSLAIPNHYGRLSKLQKYKFHAHPKGTLFEQSKSNKRWHPWCIRNPLCKKIKIIVNDNKIDKENVYNGTKKIISQNENFVTADNMISVVKTIKIKNCKGHDRIPQRIIIDGIDFLKALL